MGSVGLIIGATIGQWIDDSGVDPAKFTGPILSPGYGWQGAEAKDLRTVFKGTKGNVLVTVSRFIAAHGPDIASLSQAHRGHRAGCAPGADGGHAGGGPLKRRMTPSELPDIHPCGNPELRSRPTRRIRLTQPG